MTYEEARNKIMTSVYERTLAVLMETGFPDRKILNEIGKIIFGAKWELERLAEEYEANYNTKPKGGF